MVLEILAPGVQNSNKANLGNEVLAIGGNGDQRLGRGVEVLNVEKSRCSLELGATSSGQK